MLFAGNRIRLVAEADAMDRGPEMDYYRVEATRRPLPLQAGGAARGTMLSIAGDVDAAKPTFEDTAGALAAARQQLFGERLEAALPAGVLPRGEYSRLARASYRGDRTSPPLFGTLADGLAPLNAEDAVAARQPAPVKPPFAGLRPPIVSALLTGGTGVAKRAEVTTVRNKRTARRIAPSLASVQARVAMHLPIRMAVMPPPASVERRTVVPTGAVPRTDAPGTARSYVAGTVGGLHGLDSVVGGLSLQPKRRGRKAPGVPAALAAGDVAVLLLPDAAIDVAAEARPAVAVAGSARVAMLRGDGAVLRDVLIADGSATVPPGTALVGVQAGASPALREGLAGWHAGARVAVLGASAALGAGCVITVDSVRHARPGWSAAAEVVAGAGTVGTAFSEFVRTVVVVLADADPQRLDAPALELLGARRATLPDGRERPPVVVLRGSEAALIYAVQPDRKQPVAVRVRTGGDWRLAGVLGSQDAPDVVGRLLAERGPLAVIQRVLAVEAGSASVTWQEPAAPTRRRRGAKRAKGKKQSAKQPRRLVPAGGTNRDRGNRDGRR